MITQKTVRALFDYRDGELIRPRDAGRRWKAGTAADYKRPDGYGQVRVAEKLHYTHRVIWLWHHGEMPKYIDHADGDRRNNRIENLRAATWAQNQRNTGKRRQGTSKYKGVFRAAQKWLAQICHESKTRHLGSFDTELEAALAYNAAALELSGEFAFLNRDEAGQALVPVAVGSHSEGV